jgi:phosphoglycolate phosphatase-like HAD superfamily hydrolase
MNLPRMTCFFDCDNTLIDNDAIKVDIDTQFHALLGEELTERFWALYEVQRQHVGCVDIPGAFNLLRVELGQQRARQAWSIIWDYPFAQRVYPGSAHAAYHMETLGATIGIVSDGDQTYQPHKIRASGLADIVQGHIKVYIHKQDHINELTRWLPADRYIIVDDKPKILADIKRMAGPRFTTILVQQGHYATEVHNPHPDITIKNISELANVTVGDVLQA